jgi:hypothetical protein
VAVIELVKYSNRDTISALRVLLAMAEKGQVRGLALCYRDDGGHEPTLFTGIYREPGAAAGASLRMSMTLMQANGEL